MGEIKKRLKRVWTALTSKQKEGYLIISRHDGDELTIYFIEDHEFFKQLKAIPIKEIKDECTVVDFWMDYKCAYLPDGTQRYEHIERFWTQTFCNEPWPFEGYKILGTHYAVEY